jgi:hypothetical protein
MSPLPISPDVDNLYKSGGAIYLADRNTDGTPKGMVHMGNTPNFGGQPEVTDTEHRSSLTSEFELDVSEADEISKKGSFDLEEYSPHNMNIGVLGDGVHELSQGSGYEPAKAITVDRLDAWYDLGKRNVSGVAIAGHDENDFDVDAEGGRVFVKSSGTITKDEELNASFSYTAWAAEEVRPLTNPTLIKYLYFCGDPASGPIIEAELWKVRITINAEFPLITREYGKLPCSYVVLSDRENHPDTPFGRVIMRSAS